MDDLGSVGGGIQGRTTGAAWVVGLDVMLGVAGIGADDGNVKPPACKHNSIS